MESQANYDEFFREFGARLKALRRMSGFSQEDMLSHGFSTRHWQQIEAGRPVTMTTLLRICDAFKSTPEKILHGLYVPRPVRSPTSK